MTSTRMSPERLLSADLSADEFTARPWTVRWDDEPGPVGGLVRRALPARSSFFTSGSTGARRRWQRTAEQLWDEAGLVAEAVGRDRPEGVLAFAPPRHLYGMIATVLLPARLGVPVWYVPMGTALPPADGRRWAVVAIPWVFRVLQSRSSWFDGAARADFVHSTSVLPEAASRLMGTLHERGREASLLELFGSTETGAVATRLREGGRPLDPGDQWTLCPDVGFAAEGGGEVPLTVRSPRLAWADESGPMDVWEMDDRIRMTGERTFVFAGRRGNLVNVNGRRLDLALLEERLRSALTCADVACVPVADPLVGEHFDVLVVPGDQGAPPAPEMQKALDALPCRPRRVVSVEHIDRSETGKLRRVGTQPVADVRGGQ